MDHQALNLGSVLLNEYFMPMEATNTSLKVENEEGETARLFSRNHFAVAACLERISDFRNKTPQGAVKRLGKDIHMLKCVNCNYNFFEARAKLGSWLELFTKKGEEIVNAR